MASDQRRASHHPAELFDASKYGFAQATSVPAGRLIFVSGQVAWDATERLVATDLPGQGLLIEIEATAVVP